jgi:hypothetical protein
MNILNLVKKAQLKKEALEKAQKVTLCYRGVRYEVIL